jgi:hypothetical protein
MTSATGTSSWADRGAPRAPPHSPCRQSRDERKSHLLRGGSARLGPRFHSSMHGREHRGDGTVRSAVEADPLAVDVLGDRRTGPGGLPCTCAPRVAASTRHLGDERSIVAALLPDGVELPPHDAERSVAHPVEAPRVRRPGRSRSRRRLAASKSGHTPYRPQRGRCQRTSRASKGEWAEMAR